MSLYYVILNSWRNVCILGTQRFSLVANPNGRDHRLHTVLGHYFYFSDQNLSFFCTQPPERFWVRGGGRLAQNRGLLACPKECGIQISTKLNCLVFGVHVHQPAEM